MGEGGRNTTKRVFRKKSTRKNPERAAITNNENGRIRRTRYSCVFFEDIRAYCNIIIAAPIKIMHSVFYNFFKRFGGDFFLCEHTF